MLEGVWWVECGVGWGGVRGASVGGVCARVVRFWEEGLPCEGCALFSSA